ncbi:MAG: metallophosphoesterase [Clostridia bacterium]|nr:metallophosphoesterase [Clostridia bacterium]
MKRFVCAVLVLLFVLSAFPLFASATNKFAESDGMTFDDNSTYPVSKSYEDEPLSFESWLYVPKGAGRAGAVLGNYAGSTACVNFEITTNGRPRMYVVEYTSGEKAIHDVTFSCDIRTGEPVHVAIVHDPAAAKTYCYVNGTLKETKNGALNITAEVCKTPYMFGGDRRGGNTQYFKGAIESVAVYSYPRTENEIKKAMNSGVDKSDSGLIAYYDTVGLEGDRVKDESGNGYDVRGIVKWIKDKPPVNDYSYSFCVVGDTQVVAYKEPEKLACIYDWIVANKDSKKIEYVIGLGDITDKNTDAEWTEAREQIFKLNGVVPYSLVRGNHDGTANFNKYFDVPNYNNEFEGRYIDGKIDNTWRTFRVGETDFLLLVLDYGASDAILNWAAGIIESHPGHKVIITTHCYLYRDGTTLDVGDVCPPNASGANDGVRNNGDQMWDKLVSKYENVFLVLSGHDPSDNVVATQTEGVHGNVVTQMLVDPQGVDSSQGATGMIAMLYFSNDGKTLTVEQYSTVRDAYYMNTSQFELELPESFWKNTEAEEKPNEFPDETVSPDTEREEAPSPVETIGGVDKPTEVSVNPIFHPMSFVLGIVAGVVCCAVVFIIFRKKK